VRHNRGPRADAVALFELGHVYRPGTTKVLGLRRPRATSATWSARRSSARPTPRRGAHPSLAPPNVFTAKALVEALLDTLQSRGRRPRHAAVPAPRARRRRPRVGRGGRLARRAAPAGRARLDLEDVAVFELALDPILAAVPAAVQYEDLTSFPPVRQDLAVVVDAGRRRRRARRARAGGELLRDVRVSDRYEMDDGRVSLALHLEFAAADRTLTDEEVARVRETIVARLREELGAEPRG